MTKPQLSLLSKPHHGGILTAGNMLVSHDNEDGDDDNEDGDDDSEHLQPPPGDVLLDDFDVRVDPADRDAARQVDLRLRPDWDLDEGEEEGSDVDGDITHWNNKRP